MAKQKITLEVGEKGSAKVARAAGTVKSGWLDTAAKLTIAFQGLGKLVDMAGKAIDFFTADALKFVKISAQLNMAIGKTGKDVDKVRTGMDAYALKLQDLYGVSLDAVASHQKLFVQLTGNTEQANEAALAAEGLAAAVGIDANTAMRGLSQTMDGQAGLLGRYVPAIRGLTAEQLKSGEAIRLIAEQFGPALEANMQTSIGQYERIAKIIGDRYVEEVGLAILQNEVLTAGFKEIGNQLIANVPKWKGISIAVTDVAVVMGELLPTVIGIGTAGTTLLIDFLNVLVKIATVSMTLTKWSPWGLIWSKQIDAAKATLEGMSESLGSASKRAEDFGTTLMADAISIRDAMTKAAKNIEHGNKKAIQSWKNHGLAIKAAKEEILDLGETGLSVSFETGEVIDAAVEAAEDAFIDIDAELEKALRRKMEREKAYYEELISVHQSYWDKVDSQLNESARAQQAAAEETANNWARAATSIARNLGGAFIDIITGTKTAGEAMLDMFKQVLRMIMQAGLKMIITRAAAAASGAASAVSAIPVAGPILAVAAAASVFAAISAYTAKVGKEKAGMAYGGLIPGYAGAAGQDSVPVNAMPGERFLNRRETAEYEGMMAGRGGGQVTINLSIQAIPGSVGSPAATKKWLRDFVAPPLMELAREGFVRF